MMKRILIVGLCAVGLTACSGTKESLGLNKKAPDEFRVVKRAPLELPPDYSLRPPTPGAARPQEQSTAEQASQAMFGEGASENQQVLGASAGETALLSGAGAAAADSDIRRKVDAETASHSDDNEPVAKKLLNLSGIGDKTAPASVVNARAEAERLKQNAEDGKPVTAGDTPSVEN